MSPKDQIYVDGKAFCSLETYKGQLVNIYWTLLNFSLSMSVSGDSFYMYDSLLVIPNTQTHKHRDFPEHCKHISNSYFLGSLSAIKHKCILHLSLGKTFSYKGLDSARISEYNDKNTKR